MGFQKYSPAKLFPKYVSGQRLPNIFSGQKFPRIFLRPIFSQNNFQSKMFQTCCSGQLFPKKYFPAKSLPNIFSDKNFQKQQKIKNKFQPKFPNIFSGQKMIKKYLPGQN